MLKYTARIIDLLALIAPIIQKMIYFIMPKRAAFIRKLREWDPKVHNFILVYVGYTPNADRYSIDYLRSFRKKNAYIIFVTNHPKFEYETINQSIMDVFIDNKNQGWDFAQYKTATRYISENLTDNIPTKIIYANDSVFYLDRGNSYHVDALLDEDYDFIGAFELSGLGQHSPWQLSSWLFSTSRDLFLSENFQSFWKNHIPIKNKRHAIRNGEHKLTATALAFSGKVNSIYSNDYLISALGEHMIRRGMNQTYKLISANMHDAYEQKFENPCNNHDFAIFIQRNLHAFSPMHVFMLLLLTETGFPFIKKDIFWFGYQSYDKLDELKNIISSISSPEASMNIMRYLLLRGRVSEAPLQTRLLIRLGLR